MFLDLVSTWLATRVDVRVAVAAGDVPAAVAACATHRPDLLVLDPAGLADDGRAVLAELVGVNPAAAVVVLGDSRQTQSHGAVARVLDAAKRRLVIDTVDTSRGCDLLEHVIAGLLDATSRGARRPSPESVLSGREFDVFVRIGRGMQTAGIAGELGISPQTVETHRKSITKKLGANGANLVRIAALYVAANGHRAGRGER